MQKIVKTILFLLFACKVLNSQTTIGLQQYSSGNEDGYVLFSPIANKDVFLIDKCGKLVHNWNTNYRPGQAVYLLGNGDLIRAGYDIGPFYNMGGKGGFIERYDWNSNIVWSFKLSTYYDCLHHDFKVLPNGNILALDWSEVPLSSAFALGRNPALTSTWIWTEKILELKPIGTDSAVVVWQWNLFDHLIQNFDSTKLNFGNISQSPQLINFNYVPDPTTPDWVHINAIDYNETLDQIILTAHTLSEVWIIDHSTTTAEAASHTGGNFGKGGDLLYRWGNPAVYDRGDTTNQQLFQPHNAQWIKTGLPNEGKILIFNNGVNRPTGNYSSVDIIKTPFDSITNSYPIDSVAAYLPLNNAWSYVAPIPTDFYSSYVSGAQQLRNGGFNICSGALGNFFEIDSSKNKNWEYINPINNLGPMTQGDSLVLNNVFRCSFYYANDPAFDSVTLISGTEIEINPAVPSLCDIVGITENEKNNLSVFPNPSNDKIYVKISNLNKNDFELSVIDLLGKQYSIPFSKDDTLISIDINFLSKGLYFLNIKNCGKVTFLKFVVQ